MVPPIIVVLQRCSHQNAECYADSFASIVHFPSNFISCFHLSSARHNVALSTSPALGADHDVACPTNPTTPTPPFPRRPICSCRGSRRDRPASLEHFFIIIVVCGSGAVYGGGRGGGRPVVSPCSSPPQTPQLGPLWWVNTRAAAQFIFSAAACRQGARPGLLLSRQRRTAGGLARPICPAVAHIKGCVSAHSSRVGKEVLL